MYGHNGFLNNANVRRSGSYQLTVFFNEIMIVSILHWDGWFSIFSSTEYSNCCAKLGCFDSVSSFRLEFGLYYYNLHDSRYYTWL